MDRRDFLKKATIAAAAVPCMWLPVQLTANPPLYETKLPAFGKPTITDEGIKLLLDCYFHPGMVDVGFNQITVRNEKGEKVPGTWYLILLAHDMRPYPYGGCVPLSWDEDTEEFTNCFGEKEFFINTVQDWYGVGLYSAFTDTMWSWSAFAKPVKLPIGPIDPGDVRAFDYISYRESQAKKK